jgi:dTDP-4-dehydrorhamnose reductase
MLKIRVLVLGSGGLIGHQVYSYLDSSKEYELYNMSHLTKFNQNTILLQARNERLFFDEIHRIKPKLIINCIGVLIRSSNEDPENAIFLNSYLPHRLARLAEEINAKLIHISTDCVFSGDKIGAYVEDDIKDGRGVYAKTKGLGEVNSHKHLTLRTSVVGPELKNNGEELFHWFMNQTGEVSGYKNSIWSGVTTIELAKAVKWAIDQNITGLYHVSNNCSINKFDLLNLFKKHTNKKINIKALYAEKVDKTFMDTRLLLDYKIPSYEQMIEDMVRFMIVHSERYSQYKVENFE